MMIHTVYTTSNLIVGIGNAKWPEVYHRTPHAWNVKLILQWHNCTIWKTIEL